MRLTNHGPLRQSMPVNQPKPIPFKQISTAGFRWPAFSKEFTKLWHTEMRRLLRGNSGGAIFKAVDFPDGFRSDVHFWKEMRLWAAMAYAYADLGGDAVKDLSKDLLATSAGDTKNLEAAVTFRLALEVPDVLKMALAGVADMRARLGAEPSEWAKEHLKATGMSPKEIETVAARCSYSDWPGAATG